MQMLSRKRALDKIFKRRDRYEIPDWQRDEVWSSTRKQELIDTILRGWKLPKFYFVLTSDDPEEFEVVDGQQRLTTIFEFYNNELALSSKSTALFGGQLYKDLSANITDSFDDFEIEYDEITDATEEELKSFFQRLQQGLPLTSSEKLNSVHSSLRNFCRQLAEHEFFTSKVKFSNRRYSYFDVASKVAVIEIEGVETALRFDDLKNVFEAQSNFSSRSAVGKRILETLDYLNEAFPAKSPELRTRSLVQSIATLASEIVRSGRAVGTERKFYSFVKKFIAEYSKQVELGLDATDEDYIDFQSTVNANVRGAAKIRNKILLKKMLRLEPSFAALLDTSSILKVGVGGSAQGLANTIGDLIEKLNAKYSAKHGDDLIKATNKTMAAMRRIGKPVKSYAAYKEFISDLYFVFREGTAQRLATNYPASFTDINLLRTDLQHDVDHGRAKDVSKKRKKISSAFSKYFPSSSAVTVAPESFPVFQTNLLSAIESDLRSLIDKRL
jgi:hypothetical protein